MLMRKIDRKEPRNKHTAPCGCCPCASVTLARGHVYLVCAVVRLRHKTPPFHYAPTPFRNPSTTRLRHSTPTRKSAYLVRLRLRCVWWFLVSLAGSCSAAYATTLQGCYTATALRYMVAFCSLRHTTAQTRRAQGQQPHPPRPMPAVCLLRGSLLHCALSNHRVRVARLGAGNGKTKP